MDDKSFSFDGSGESSNISSSEGSPIQVFAPDVPAFIDESLRCSACPAARQGDEEVLDPDVSVREAASALVSLFGQMKWSPTFSPKKRHRRTNEELSKEFNCTIDGCGKSYASAGALKTHLGLKHIFIASVSPKKSSEKAPRSPRSPRSPR